MGTHPPQTPRVGLGRTLRIVFGPRTRLGCALLETTAVGQDDVLLLARNQTERDLLSRRWPRAAIATEAEAGDAGGHEWPGDVESIAVHVCALGPIHPTAPEWNRDAAATNRDLGTLGKLLQENAQASVHIVFASSVLAMAPGRERGYYAGWKCLIEATIAEMAARHGRARMSVLYPGRLVESRSIARPASLLHATYAQMARVMAEVGDSSQPRRMLLGLDARLWLPLQSLRNAARVLRWRLSG